MIIVALLMLKITITIVIFDDKLVTMFYNKYYTVYWHRIVATGYSYFSSACYHGDSIKCFSDKEVDIGSKYTITCTVDGGSAPNKVELIKPDMSKLIWTDTGFVFCFLQFSHGPWVSRTRERWSLLTPLTNK